MQLLHIKGRVNPLVQDDDNAKTGKRIRSGGADGVEQIGRAFRAAGGCHAHGARHDNGDIGLQEGFECEGCLLHAVGPHDDHNAVGLIFVNCFANLPDDFQNIRNLHTIACGDIFTGYNGNFNVSVELVHRADILRKVSAAALA